MSENNQKDFLPVSANNNLPPAKEKEQVFLSEKKIVYQSEVMKQLMEMVEKVSSSEVTVLVLGDSGTGKELIAQAVHRNSDRADKPFVAINCGALQETLLESELFGHEKGAFTGAYTRKLGFAELANGGTLFLDEIGQMSLSMQSKLLRFLQEGEIYRVGGKEPIQVNIRLISATNVDLEKEVEKGRFREDLFYRINTITLNTPPLRRRKEDILLLANHFMNLNRSESESFTFDQSAQEVLEQYSWPGNIRELQNICERIQILAESNVIKDTDLPEQLKKSTAGKEFNIFSDYEPSVSIHDLEKQYILRSLEYFSGNKTECANALGITIKTLYNKLHEYGKFKKFAVQNRGK